MTVTIKLLSSCPLFVPGFVPISVPKSANVLMGSPRIRGSSMDQSSESLSWGSHNSHFTMVYGRFNELVNGVYKPIYNWGGTILYE